MTSSCNLNGKGHIKKPLFSLIKGLCAPGTGWRSWGSVYVACRGGVTNKAWKYKLTTHTRVSAHWNKTVNEQVYAHVRAHIDIPLSVHPFSHQWGSERGMKWAGSRIERIKVPSRDTMSAAPVLLFPGCSRFFWRQALSDPVNLKLIEWHCCQILGIKPQHWYGTVLCCFYLPARETVHFKCSVCQNRNRLCALNLNHIVNLTL